MPIAILRSGNGPGERWPWRPNSSISTICSRSPTRALATSPRRRRACASGTCTCASAIWRRRKASIIGLDPARRRSGASFLSSGRYHHHLGMNVWQSAGAGRRSVAVTILDPSAAPTASRTGATGVGGGQISGTIFLRTGGPGSYEKNSELNPKSPPIHVCFREKSGHRILSASSRFMTRSRLDSLPAAATQLLMPSLGSAPSGGPFPRVTPQPSSRALAALGWDRDKRCVASIDVGLRRLTCGRRDLRQRAGSGRWRI
jgi:hypothetical protein